MKLLLDIKDSKALSLLEVLKGLSYVKTELLTPTKARFLKGLKDAVEQVNLHKQGKIKLKSARQLLDEL